MTLQEQAYLRLKDAILSSELPPGEPVQETEWAERLGMSRTPVREALQRLEYEGLVANDRRGWIVYCLSVDDVAQVFDIKIALESMTARRAAERLTEEQAARLREALADMARATERHDIENWHQADQGFHQVLFDAAGNPRLEQIIKGLNEQTHRVRVSHLALEGRMGRSLDEHRLIAEKVLARDGPAAGEAMRAHLQELRRSIMDILERIVLPLGRLRGGSGQSS